MSLPCVSRLDHCHPPCFPLSLPHTHIHSCAHSELRKGRDMTKGFVVRSGVRKRLHGTTGKNDLASRCIVNRDPLLALRWPRSPRALLCSRCPWLSTPSPCLDHPGSAYSAPQLIFFFCFFGQCSVSQSPFSCAFRKVTLLSPKLLNKMVSFKSKENGKVPLARDICWYSLQVARSCNCHDLKLYTNPLYTPYSANMYFSFQLYFQ